MPRAHRHYSPGYVWHITHRCHKKEFLLKFSKDRKRYLYWIYCARKQYGLVVLDYMVTSNHIHLLVYDDGEREDISRSIQLIAGRTAQEFNKRKNRKGAFWEDRYHATAVQTDDHLLRCIAYIDMNMVRTGVVKHPREWFFSGYHEIQYPRRKNRIISIEHLLSLSNFSSVQDFRQFQESLILNKLNNGLMNREALWTESIAVGNLSFIEKMKSNLGIHAKGRSIQEFENHIYALREPEKVYNADFISKKGDIGPKNTHFWQIYA